MSRRLGWDMREREDPQSRGLLLARVAHRLRGLKEGRSQWPRRLPFAADFLLLPLKALTSWRLHLFPLKVPAKVSWAEEQESTWHAPFRAWQPDTYHKLSISISPGGELLQCPGDPGLQHAQSEPGEHQGLDPHYWASRRKESICEGPAPSPPDPSGDRAWHGEHAAAIS